MRRAIALTLVLLFGAPLVADAQMTYRLRGVVRDNSGKPVEGARVRVEALNGFRGEQFVGQREFATTTNGKGEWVILGVISGIWAIEATAPEVIPQVILLPINFTNRTPQSARGGSFPWDVFLTVRRTTNERLTAAAAAATARRADEAVQVIGTLAAETDPEVVCAAGELALMVRQFGLANALFTQIAKTDPKNSCATVGMASSALMQNDFDRAAKMMWAAIDLVPREQRPAFGAAVKDLQQIAGTNQ